MRKVFKGRVYDTESARFICSTGTSDIYRKKTGEFFQYFRSPDIEIVPLSVLDAQSIIDENSSEDVYIREFGIPSKDISVSMALSGKAYSRLRLTSSLSGISYGVLISQLICDNL